MQTLSLLTSLCAKVCAIAQLRSFGLWPAAIFCSADFRVNRCDGAVLHPARSQFSCDSGFVSIAAGGQWRCIGCWRLAIWRCTRCWIGEPARELGYCQGVLATVLDNREAWRVRGLFLVAILNVALLILDRDSRRASKASRHAGCTSSRRVALAAALLREGRGSTCGECGRGPWPPRRSDEGAGRSGNP